MLCLSPPRFSSFISRPLSVTFGLPSRHTRFPSTLASSLFSLPPSSGVPRPPLSLSPPFLSPSPIPRILCSPLAPPFRLSASPTRFSRSSSDSAPPATGPRHAFCGSASCACFQPPARLPRVLCSFSCAAVLRYRSPSFTPCHFLFHASFVRSSLSPTPRFVAGGPQRVRFRFFFCQRPFFPRYSPPFVALSGYGLSQPAAGALPPLGPLSHRVGPFRRSCALRGSCS